MRPELVKSQGVSVSCPGPPFSVKSHQPLVRTPVTFGLLLCLQGGRGEPEGHIPELLQLPEAIGSWVPEISTVL